MRKTICASILAMMLLIFPASGFAYWPTPIPIPSWNLFDEEVSVPDASLNTALHEYAGIPPEQALHKDELAALTGYFGCDGVANAEGIQYCTGLTSVTLSYGTLTDMPNMSGMSGLRTLYLEYDAFSAVPEGICHIPGLQRLSLIGNEITDLDRLTSLYKLTALYLDHCGLDGFPQEILGMKLTTLSLNGNILGGLPSQMEQMSTLQTFYAEDTGLERIPSVLYQLNNLSTLFLDNNDISDLPSDISSLENLNYLSLSYNELTSLPDSLCEMEKLSTLQVSYNYLENLPEDIARHIYQLTARGNRISFMPQSALYSERLCLDLAFNQLTLLPQGFESVQIDTFNLQYNFIDVSEGSQWRQMLDANPTNYKKYMKQLTLPTVSAQAASDSVTLTWTPGADGTAGQARWKVTGYEIYQYEGSERIRIEELDSDARSFTQDGLSPAAAYEYCVAVVYAIDDAEEDFSGAMRGYAHASATTLAAAQTSDASAVSATAVTNAPVSASPVSTAQTTGMVPRERPGIPWPVYAGAGALLAGACVAAALTIRKRYKAK